MDGTLAVAIVAVILAAGSLLVAAASLRGSMTGKQTGIRIQAEQRKQEALGILYQAQFSFELYLNSIETRSFESEVAKQELVNGSKEHLREFERVIQQLQELEPPEGKFDSSYLVTLEKTIGNAQGSRLVVEHVHALLDSSGASDGS